MTNRAASIEVPDPNLLGTVTPWDFDFRQIEAGDGVTRVTVRPGATLLTMRIRLPFRVHQRGAAPRDRLTFGLPSPNHLSAWHQAAVPERPLVCFGSGQEFDGVSKAGFEGTTLSVTRTDFEAGVEDFGLPFPEQGLDPAILDVSSLLIRDSCALSPRPRAASTKEAQPPSAPRRRRCCS